MMCFDAFTVVSDGIIIVESLLAPGPTCVLLITLAPSSLERSSWEPKENQL